MYWGSVPVDDIKPLSLLNEAKGSKAETDPSCVAHEAHVMWEDEVGRRRFFKKIGQNYEYKTKYKTSERTMQIRGPKTSQSIRL